MNRIKEVRIKKNLKQKDLAELTGLSTAAISTFENGKTMPSMNSAFKISKVLGVTIDDLYAVDKSPIIDRDEVKQNV